MAQAADQKKKIIIGVGAVVLIAVIFIVYSNMQHSKLVENLKRKTNLIVGMAKLPETLNPLLTRSEAGLRIVDTIFDGLYNLSGTTIEQYENALADDIIQDSRDKKVYTVELNTDKVWQDDPNHKFSAADVIYSFNAILKASNDSPLRGRLSKQIHHIEEVDEGEIKIVFREALAPAVAPALMNFKIIPATYYGKKMGIDLKNDPVAKEFSRSPIGTGSFKISSWEGNDITLASAAMAPANYDTASNSDLHKPESLRKVTFTQVQDLEKQAKMLMDGKIDVILNSDPDLHKKLSDAGLTPADYVSHHFYSLVINTKKAPFNQNKVRRGLARAINKTAAVSVVWSDKPEDYINKGPFPHNGERQYESFKELNPHNMAAAKRALAGVKGTKATLIYPEMGVNTMERIAGRIVQDLTDAGLVIESKSLGMAFDTQLKNKNFDLALVKQEGFTKGYDITPLFHSRSANNYTGFGNAKFDKLLGKWSGAGYWETKLPLGMKVHDKLSKDSPYVFLFTLPTRAYLSPRVKEHNIVDPSALLGSMESWTVTAE